MELRRGAYESQWSQQHNDILLQQKLSQFTNEHDKISSTLVDLNKKLDDHKGNYGESVTTSKNISQVFEQVETVVKVNITFLFQNTKTISCKQLNLETS